MPMPTATKKFLELCARVVRQNSLVKLTLGKPCGPDGTLKNVFVRPVSLRAGPRLSFVFRHATRDVTRNFTFEDGLAQIEVLLGGAFQTANLFTTDQSAELELRDSREPRLVLGKPPHPAPADTRHDRPKRRSIDPKDCPWLRALGVTTADNRVAKGMEAKFRQIDKFVELLQPLLKAARLMAKHPLSLVDMGCGKGYLTFAAYDVLRRGGTRQLQVRGVESRPELVDLCNGIAAANQFDGLRFEAGTIESVALERVDVLVALHACDTATDDAIATGIRAGASLIVVAPCCHRELGRQLRPPPALAPAFQHGILRERQAEFVTDALRAALLEWAGYDAKVFEFIATEHTAKNLMIAAVKTAREADRDQAARRVQALAGLYGIASQRLAGRLGFLLNAP